MEGIILAAGMSTRFPEYKMLQKIDGVTLIEKTVTTMKPFVDKIIVVTGFNSHLIHKLLSNEKKVTLVENANYKRGMYSSIKCGMNIASEDVFLIPGDMAFVSSNTYKVLSHYKNDVVIPSYNMKAGHPIKLSYRVVNDIRKSNHEHLRACLTEYKKKYIVVEDPYILIDIDTKEDLDKVRGRIR